MIEKHVVTCSIAAGGLLERSLQTADDVSAADACGDGGGLAAVVFSQGTR